MSIKGCIKIHAKALQDAGVDISTLKTPEDVQAQLDGLTESRNQIDEHVAAERAKVVPEQALLQEEDEKLGFFDPETNTIGLLENANLSTFLHESGHFFFEAYRTLAKSSPEIAEDMQALLEFVGVPSLDTWNGMTLEERRAGHEKVAEAFEKYLFEGNAPTVELGGLFARFRSWLISLYSELRMEGVELNNEVRQVFDRMLATQDAIDFRSSTNASLPMFEDAARAQMTPQQWEELQALRVREKADAETEVHTRANRNIKWFLKAESKETKKLQKEAESIRRATHKQITVEVEQEPVYRTLAHLTQKGVPKLSREEFRARYPKAPLPRGATEAGGLPSDVIVAEIGGWESGGQMLEALSKYENKKARIDRLTVERMLKEHGDLMDPEAMQNAVNDAIHNDVHLRVLHTELKTLDKLIGKPSMTHREAKLMAERGVARMKWKGLSPDKFLRLAAREARNARHAWGRGDREGAANHKRGEILYNQYYRVARDIKKREAINKRKFRQLRKPGTRKNIDIAQLDQVDHLFEKTGIVAPTDKVYTPFAEWHQKELDSNAMLIMESDFMEGVTKKYEDMTVEEAAGFVDVIDNIVHLGRDKKKIIKGTEKADLDETVEGVREAAFASNKQRKDPNKRENKPGDTVKWIDSAFASLIRPEFFAEQMDGWKEGGAFWNIFYRPVADAENHRSVLREAANEAMKPVLDSDTFKNLGEKIFINNTAGHYTKDNIVAMALNMGNETNLKALVEGEEIQDLTEEDIRRIVNENLTQEDFQNVQKTWDFIDTYWPEIDALMYRLTGVHPKRVTATPLVTPYGTLRGGYYPLVYDSELSYKTFTREIKIGEEQYLDSLKPYTQHSHDQARVGGNKMPVKLTTQIIGQHIANVTHDLAFREAVISVDKVITHKVIKDTVERIAGKEVYRTLRPWLSHVASGDRMIVDFGEILAKGLRKNATLVSMGLKLSTMIVQPLGYTQTVDLLGPRWALHGVTEFFGNPVKMKALMEEINIESQMMKDRPGAFDRDINDNIAKLIGKKGKLATLQEYAYKHIAYADLMVSYPTYLAGRDKALAEGRSPEDAIALGERAVRLAQSAGTTTSLPSVQYGNEYKKLFTMFYTYFSSFHNLQRRRLKIAANEPMDLENLAHLSMSFLYLAAIPAVLSEIIAGRGPDDDEEWATWAAKEVLSYPALGIVGVRDMVQVFTSGYSYTPTPAVQAMESIMSVAAKASEGKIPSFSETLMGLGYATGLPARQMITVMENTAALVQGKDMDPTEVLMIKKYRE